MHEDLLGYLLGALSADEQRRVEDALAADPQLRLELDRIRRSLEPLDALDDDECPPAGLADRTLRAIDHHGDACRPTPRSIAPRRSQAESSLPSSAGSQSHLYNVSDGIVLALVGLAAITMLLPALANSRYESRKDACQNNLRQIGSLLIDDSFRHGGTFLQVPQSGQRAFDGVFASKMVQRQLLPVNTTVLLCPGVSRHEEQGQWRVPTLQQIDLAVGSQLDRFQRMAGGSYAFAVGYQDAGNNYRPIRNAGRANFPILSDVPSLHLEGRQSANHLGRGQNFMYEDGHITFVTRLTRFVGDDPWRNRQGHAEAGMDRDDAVLLRSEWAPLPPRTKQP